MAYGSNRYSRRKQHKREMKKRYAKLMRFPGSVKEHEMSERRSAEEYADSYWLRKHPPRNGGYEYWARCSHNRRRAQYKRMASKQVRRAFKEALANEDYEDIMAANNSVYRKIYDLWWELD